jgi:hypothetical protein
MEIASGDEERAGHESLGIVHSKADSIALISSSLLAGNDE